jgi:hypothetical protein
MVKYAVMCAQQCKLAVWSIVVTRESCSDDKQCQHIAYHCSVTQQCEDIDWHFLGYEVIIWRVLSELIAEDRLLWTEWSQSGLQPYCWRLPWSCCRRAVHCIVLVCLENRKVNLLEGLIINILVFMFHLHKNYLNWWKMCIQLGIF